MSSYEVEIEITRTVRVTVDVSGAYAPAAMRGEP